MAPLRRYLRITKYSVLEVRIYLDRPSDAEAWLLKRGDPALPRVIEAIRPLVLPKLREENERGKGRGGAKAKKKGVKDVVVQDDFEVSIFLTELSCRHSVLSKQKIFKDQARIQSNSGKLTSWLTAGTSSDEPVVISEDAAEPIAIREEDDDDLISLSNIPEVSTAKDRDSHGRESESESDGDESESSVSEPGRRRSTTRNKGQDRAGGLLGDDQKKLGLGTSYEGFSIYGRILCLVIKRRGARNTASGSGSGSGAASSQAMLENWVSTQAVADGPDDEDDAA